MSKMNVTAEMWDALLGTDMSDGAVEVLREIATEPKAGGTYVVYEIESTRIQVLNHHAFGRNCPRTDTVSLPYAKRVAKKLGDKFAVAELNHFRANIEKFVTVKNMMSGKPVQQRVNTPRSCDVSSELYWSM